MGIKRDMRLGCTICVAGGLMAMFVLLSGCSTSRSLQADGLPGEEYLVGGGMMINWEAPADGTAFLVEKTTGKIVETRSMKRGDTYDFSVGSAGQALEFEKVFGVKLSEARLMLYFEPATPGHSGM